MEVLTPLIKQKKSFVDFISLFFAITVLFGVAIFAMILYTAYNDNVKGELNDALTSSTPVDADANVTKVLDSASSGISKLNPLFPLLLIGIFGYVIMLVFLARSHPAFFFIGLIVLGVALIIAAVFSNVYEAIGDKDAFSDTDAEFSVIAFIMDNLPIISFILFIAIAVILYAMRSGPPQGGAY